MQAYEPPYEGDKADVIELYPHTITSIAAECQVTRRTVQGWYSKAKDEDGVEEIGVIDGSGTRRFSAAQAGRLKRFHVPKPKEEATQSFTIPEVGTNPGSQIEVQLPWFEDGQQFSLSQWQPGQELIINDPESFADNLLAAMDAVDAAMDADLNRRQKELETIQLQNAVVSDRLQEMKAKAAIYKRKATKATAEKGDAIAELQQNTEEFKGMGKPKPQPE